MIRTKRKINKQRGSRSNGGGCTKKRRGAGNKGIYLEEQAENLIASGKASKDGDAIVIDVTELGYDKVLAKGNITKTFKISAPKFSAGAIEKIEELGGEAIEL